jgi:hypothetical protein
MKFYTYSDGNTVNVTVTTDGIGVPARQTILAVTGIIPAAIALGLTKSTLAPVTVHTSYLLDLAIRANLKLTVRENVGPITTLVSPTGGGVAAAPTTATGEGDNDDNSGNLANGDALRDLPSIGDQQKAAK